MVVRNHEPLDELMAPWKLYVPVEGHWGDVVTEEEKAEYLAWYKDMCRELYDEEPKDELTFDETYDEDEDTYQEETYLRFKKDENGVWRHWVEWEYNPDGYWEGWSEGDLHARKGDIPNLEGMVFDVLIMDGQWIDVDGKVYDYIKDLPDDVELVCIGMRDLK